MYGIPLGFDLQELIGKSINFIGVSSNNLIFYFGKDWSITCEGKVEVEYNNNRKIVWNSDSWGDINSLNDVIEQDIINWKTDSKKVFSIEFINHFTLIFTDDSEMYEAFHIDPKGWLI